MSDALDRAAGTPAPVTLEVIARQQRYVILGLMFVSLLLGVLIGAVLTRGVLADPDNKITISANGGVPDALSESFARAAEIVEPAVVHLDVRDGREDLLAREAKGSGVLVTASGYILTNHHVVEGANTIKVRLNDHREFDGTLIGFDRDTDLAVIKISANEQLPFAHFGDSSKLRVGDWVLAVGSPFGLEQTVTAGIISAKERETGGGATAFQQFLQTDAAINPGNSGGPLVSLSGEVVGINTQIATRTGAFSGIGFAMPSSTAIDVYNQLVSKGRVNRGFLGIEVGEVSPDLARQNGLDSTEGVRISRFSVANGPAQQGGLQPDDVIVEINGERVKEGRELIRKIGAMPAGTIVKLTYVRNGIPATATVKLADREEGLAQSRPRQEDPDDGDGDFDDDLPPGHPDVSPFGPKIGATLRTLTPDLARDRALEGLTGAFVLDVEQNSPAAAAGLQAGDVIVSVNGGRVAGEPEFQDRLSGLRSGESAKLQVARRSGARIERRFVTLTMP